MHNSSSDRQVTMVIVPFLFFDNLFTPEGLGSELNYWLQKPKSICVKVYQNSSPKTWQFDALLRRYLSISAKHQIISFNHIFFEKIYVTDVKWHRRVIWLRRSGTEWEDLFHGCCVDLHVILLFLSLEFADGYPRSFSGMWCITLIPTSRHQLGC